MGQNWVVDNRTGAAGNLGSEIVARANPDGHTVLLALDTILAMGLTRRRSRQRRNDQAD
jgi:tripartite-type tricarboxylate transporter receptor subunit TctC